MKTKARFNPMHQTLNAMQLQAAYQLSEIEGFDVVGKTATKDGLNLYLHENGNALTYPDKCAA